MHMARDVYTNLPLFHTRKPVGLLITAVLQIIEQTPRPINLLRMEALRRTLPKGYRLPCDIVVNLSV